MRPAPVRAPETRDQLLAHRAGSIRFTVKSVSELGPIGTKITKHIDENRPLFEGFHFKDGSYVMVGDGNDGLSTFTNANDKETVVSEVSFVQPSHRGGNRRNTKKYKRRSRHANRSKKIR